MVKLVVLYPAPADPAAFEAHYRGTHGPLVDAIPGLDRWDTALGQPGPDGAAPPFYRITELHFADAQALAAGMGSEQGRAAGADLPNFAPAGTQTFVAVVD